MFQEKWRRWTRGHQWLDGLKIRALTPTNFAFLLYYLIVIIYSERAIGSVGMHQGWQYTWPGFESQVSCFLNNIFSLTFRCSAYVMIHDTPPDPSVHASKRFRSRAQNWRTQYTWVNVPACEQKSLQRQKFQWAGVSWIIPPNLGLNPPWFAILYIFLIFYF